LGAAQISRVSDRAATNAKAFERLGIGQQADIFKLEEMPAPTFSPATIHEHDVGPAHHRHSLEQLAHRSH